MSKVLIDSNIFLYFLLDSFTSDVCKDKILEMFESINDKKLKAYTTTRIVDEVIFKLMLANSKYKTKTFHKLKNDKEEAKRLHFVYEEFFTFLEDFSIEVINISKTDLQHSASIVKEFGIFGNDAITLKVMLKKDIEFIATCDGDFGNIEIVKKLI
jgi:predicted nucleic acid-binding protein